MYRTLKRRNARLRQLLKTRSKHQERMHRQITNTPTDHRQNHCRNTRATGINID